MGKIATKRNQHVYYNLRGEWGVRQTGARRASKVFEREKDAIAYARKVARQSKVVLFVHRRDGSVRLMSTFGKDVKAGE